MAVDDVSFAAVSVPRVKRTEGRIGPSQDRGAITKQKGILVLEAAEVLASISQPVGLMKRRRGVAIRVSALDQIFHRVDGLRSGRRRRRRPRRPATAGQSKKHSEEGIDASHLPLPPPPARRGLTNSATGRGRRASWTVYTSPPAGSAPRRSRSVTGARSARIAGNGVARAPDAHTTAGFAE